MLNIKLIMIYIILDYQINKHVIRVISCYPILNWIMFEFVIFNLFIISVWVNKYSKILLIYLLTLFMNTNTPPGEHWVLALDQLS